MKPAIAYLRVSTECQATEGVSLDAQAARIRQWCQLNDMELVGEYVDAGVSGKRADNRPQLQAALNHASQSGAALVVYSLSRMSRSVADTLAIADRLERAGADLVSLSEKIDTTSASGRMVFKMLAVLSEFERETTAERTRHALAIKKTNGERVGTVPYGYILGADGVTLHESADEQSIINTIRELRAAGESMRAIADELTNRGVVTKSGESRWSHTTIARILKRA
jgi:site-specific DNA recombinase